MPDSIDDDSRSWWQTFRKDLPGNPDIVLPKYKTAIFVHGLESKEFYHV